jgi:hypothetical protein
MSELADTDAMVSVGWGVGVGCFAQTTNDVFDRRPRTRLSHEVKVA